MTATGIHAGAIPVTSVQCPPWCQVAQEKHLAELPNWEGHCIHWHDTESVHWSVRLGASTYADGLPDEDAPGIYVTAPAESLTLEDAERIARAILSAVTAYKGALRARDVAAGLAR